MQHVTDSNRSLYSRDDKKETQIRNHKEWKNEVREVSVPVWTC